MLKTIDPKKNLPQASHKINQNMKEYSFPVNKKGAAPVPPQKDVL